MEYQNSRGHLAAFFTVFVWGTTFISTKVLLVDFNPVEILFFRFIMGFLALSLACPHRLKGTTGKQELTFFAAGLCGICLYYLLENIALTYTLASNVGIVLSVAPFFTGILSHFLMRGEERLNANFLVGFLVAIAGICMISFNGSQMQLNPMGDLLAIAAAVVWAFYALLTRKISTFGFNTIQTTRKCFGYGILCMVPTLFFFDFNLGLERFARPANLFNIVFLGLCASATCFVTWNYAVKVLGAVKTSVYIYLSPVVTVVTSMLVLHEEITPLAVLGTIFTLSGLVISEFKFKKKQNKCLKI